MIRISKVNESGAVLITGWVSCKIQNKRRLKIPQPRHTPKTRDKSLFVAIQITDNKLYKFSTVPQFLTFSPTQLEGDQWFFTLNIHSINVSFMMLQNTVNKRGILWNHRMLFFVPHSRQQVLLAAYKQKPFCMLLTGNMQMSLRMQHRSPPQVIKSADLTSIEIQRQWMVGSLPTSRSASHWLTSWQQNRLTNTDQNAARLRCWSIFGCGV